MCSCAGESRVVELFTGVYLAFFMQRAAATEMVAFCHALLSQIREDIAQTARNKKASSSQRAHLQQLVEITGNWQRRIR